MKEFRKLFNIITNHCSNIDNQYKNRFDKTARKFFKAHEFFKNLPEYKFDKI